MMKVKNNQLHGPRHTVLFLILLLGALYHTTVIKLFSVKNEVETFELTEKTDSIILKTIAATTVKTDSLEKKKEIETETTIKREKTQDRTVDLLHNLWHPTYDTCSVTNMAKEKRISGSKTAKKHLWRFFEKLNGLSTESQLHVLHFGDSQIEGDRITGRIRSSWQKTWGGSGPGLIPAIQPVPALSVRQKHEGNMKRYTKFGKRDTTVTHTCFGGMATFTTVLDHGKVTVKPHPSGFRKNQVWEQAEVLIGAAPLGGKLTVSGEFTDSITVDIAPSSTGHHSSIVIELAGIKEEVVFEFEGHEIEITGIQLGSGNGLAIHNIPMRSSSGTVFKSLDKKHFKRYLQNWDVGMVILQYGGNTAPYVKDELSAMRYGKRFQSQLKYLKTILPEATFLVIGPSDMGVTNDSSLLTYPMLGAIRIEMKKVTLIEEALYWDLFEAMGGPGTMEIWAGSTPRLASPDLVHFTPKGAKIIGELFDQTIRAEHRFWEQEIVGE